VLDDPIPLETGLAHPVVLRRLSTADVTSFARHIAHDVARLGQHLPWPDAAATREGAEQWLGPYERREDGRVVAAGAWCERELLGGAVLFRHDAQQRAAEIGCWVVAAGEGQGLASAMCRALLRLARSDLGVERIEWRSVTVNLRSRRLAERLGFRHEGTLRSSYVLRDARLDTDVLSLVGGEIDQAAAGTLRPA
jgi:ribosomal-protein-serine acetyltransferase